MIMIDEESTSTRKKEWTPVSPCLILAFTRSQSLHHLSRRSQP